MRRVEAALAMLYTPGNCETQRRGVAGIGHPTQVELTGIAGDWCEVVRDVECEVSWQGRAVKAEVVPGKGVGPLVDAVLVAVVVDIFHPHQAPGQGEIHIGDHCQLGHLLRRVPRISTVDIDLVLRDAQLEMVHVPRPRRRPDAADLLHRDRPGTGIHERIVTHEVIDHIGRVNRDGRHIGRYRRAQHTAVELARRTVSRKANPEPISRDRLERAFMIERCRHRLIGVPQLGPRPMIPVTIVAHIKRDRPRPPSNVKWLLRIHRQRCDDSLVGDRIRHLPVADGNVVRRLHLHALPALLQGGRHGRVVLPLTKVHHPDLAGNTPQGPVQVTGAVSDPRRLIEGLAQRDIGRMIRLLKLARTVRGAGRC